MKATARWPKLDLLAVAEELRRGGFDIPPREVLEQYTKTYIAFLINDAERPAVAWGVDVNDLTIEKQTWVWDVKRPDGRKICSIDFTQAYEWNEGSHSADFLAALEVCLVRAPLEVEDRQRLEGRRPGITGKQLFEVDLEAWEIEDEPDPEPVAPPAPPAPKPPEPKVEAAPRPLSPKRKIRL